MKIYILHHNRYWTEYVDFLLDDQEHFALVASRVAAEPYRVGEEMEVFDPDKHKVILTPGRLHEPTCNNKIIMRFLHSPGFFTYPMLRAYADLTTKHRDSDYVFMPLEEHYRAMALRELNDPAVDHFRHALMSDPKVHRLALDPMMHKIQEAPNTVERQPDTGLLCLTWLLIDNAFTRFLEIAETLQKTVKVNLLLHPLMRMDETYLHKIQKLEGTLFDTIYYNLTRDELIDVYDRHEYVISDGSGSCYEAMLRGCRPLAVRGLRSSTKDESFNEVLEIDYLPFPSYEEIGKNPDYDSVSFLKKQFPYLNKYTYAEAVKIATEEIISINNIFS